MESGGNEQMRGALQQVLVWEDDSSPPHLSAQDRKRCLWLFQIGARLCVSKHIFLSLSFSSKASQNRSRDDIMCLYRITAWETFDNFCWYVIGKYYIILLMIHIWMYINQSFLAWMHINRYALYKDLALCNFTDKYIYLFLKKKRKEYSSSIFKNNICWLMF